MMPRAEAMKTRRTGTRLAVLALLAAFAPGCDRGVGQAAQVDDTGSGSPSRVSPSPSPSRPEQSAPQSSGPAPTGASRVPGSGFAPGAGLPGFRLLEGYVLELDGEPVDGVRIYNEPTPSVLLMAPSLPAPVVLWLEARRVETINLLKVSRNDDGGIDILPNPTLEVHERPLSIVGGGVHFEVAGRSAVLKPKPFLLGLKVAEDLTDDSEAYAQRADFYQPSDEALDALRRESRDVRVRIYFGSWCPACSQMVPRAIKVSEALAGSNIRFEFYGLPRQIRDDPEANRDDIRQVPTGVVYADDREIGRINGVEWRSPEAALTALLSG